MVNGGHGECAHGVAVGLPSDEDMGNSEVGHNAMGAGRIIEQGARLVNAAIKSGAIFEGETWKRIAERCGKGGALHLIGLLSDGNVHSHEQHLFALIRRADADGFADVCVHALLDGRDVPETSALDYVDRLEALLAEINAKGDRRYVIASGGGRMKTTMDRYENDWGMVERGWNAQVHGEGRLLRERARGHRDLPARGAGDHRPVPTLLRGGGRRQTGRADEGRRFGDLLQLPR